MDNTILHSVLELVGLFIVFISILLAAYYFTKKIAQFKQGSTHGHNMKVMEVLPIAIGQAIYIIKIGQEYHLFTATKEKIEHCGKVEKDYLEFKDTPFYGIKDELFKNTLFGQIKMKEEKHNEGKKK